MGIVVDVELVLSDWKAPKFRQKLLGAFQWNYFNCVALNDETTKRYSQNIRGYGDETNSS